MATMSMDIKMLFVIFIFLVAIRCNILIDYFFLNGKKERFKLFFQLQMQFLKTHTKDTNANINEQESKDY